MKRFFTLLIAFTTINLCVVSQDTTCIPEGKYELCLDNFVNRCRSTIRPLPFFLKMRDFAIDMEYKIFAPSLYKPFIIDCNDSILYYMTKPVYRWNMDTDSLMLVMDSYKSRFIIESIGCFDYKDFMIVVYSFPLDDPNYYKWSYTINIYTKDGKKRLDRMPFFLCRLDLDLNDWIEDSNEYLDELWLEQTGYIDKNFEITIRQRTPWNDLNNEYGRPKEGLTQEEYDKLHEHVEYHVYHISDDGHFVEIDKEPQYEVNDENQWKKKQ